jgi:hypothetical protein
MASFDELMQQFESASTEARAATDRRLAQATAIYDEIINRYQPGGAFERRGLAQLESQRTRDVGTESQQLISSGLYGTTTMGGVGRRWEESVGEPAKLALEDTMMQRLSQAQTGKAGLLERVEDVGPDPGLYAQLMGQAASGPSYIGSGSQPGPTGPSVTELTRQARASNPFMQPLGSSFSQPSAGEGASSQGSTAGGDTSGKDINWEGIVKEYTAQVKKYHPNKSLSFIDVDYVKKLLAANSPAVTKIAQRYGVK